MVCQNVNSRYRGEAIAGCHAIASRAWKVKHDEYRLAPRVMASLQTANFTVSFLASIIDRRMTTIVSA